MSSSRLKNFLDEDGRVKQWPAKRVSQVEVIGYIARKFVAGSDFTEKEINEEIKKLHTFGDWAIIRRELCEMGYFSRDRNGTTYTRTTKD